MPRLSDVLRVSGSALLTLLLAAPLARAQSTSPLLVEPPEIASAGGKLRAALAIRDADVQIPNTGKRHLRYFEGWKLPDDASALTLPAPPASRPFGPGPTLRARIGEDVRIMFFNQVDEKNFAYTNDGSDCDKTFTVGTDGKTSPVYPFRDNYPNCFHGSSTANLHFHGTHTSPNGTGDNVLLEVIPHKDRSMEPKWARMFEKVFAGPIPRKFTDLPPEYWEEQKKLLPAKLREADEQRIAAGLWPQYLVGAFPNYLVLPADPAGGSGYTAGQAPGTHWYHAHKHGSTALHMFNGLAGALVIEGPYDDYLRSYYGLKEYGRFEKILVLQQGSDDVNLSKNAPIPPPAMLVNGQLGPTIEMKPGEVQLWRIVNATPGGGGAANLASGFFAPGNGFIVRQTAQDGVQFSPANYRNQPYINGTIPGGLAVAGGNRVDVLVKAPGKAGTYAFRNGTRLVLWVRVTGEAGPMCLPEEPSPCKATRWPDMPGYLAGLAAPPADVYPHSVTFGWDPEATRTGVVKTTQPPRFTIDNRQFGERGPSVDQCVKLGDSKDNLVVEWLLMNTTPTGHPFHIHINPFQVVSIETPSFDKTTGVASYKTYKPASDLIWQDVIMIPAGATVFEPVSTDPLVPQATQKIVPGRVIIRQRFVDFPGDFLLHCHILAHEDRGMMQLVRVVPPADYPEKCQALVPAHH